MDVQTRTFLRAVGKFSLPNCQLNYTKLNFAFLDTLDGKFSKFRNWKKVLATDFLQNEKFAK